VSRLECWKLALVIVMACLAPVAATAQTAAVSRSWIAVGGASTTLQGACGEGCDLEGPYLNTGSVLANVGYRVNSRMDAGVEILWTPSTTTEPGDKIRSTFLVGVAQFRPWESRGFSVKAGMGMAFVRNWVYDISGVSPTFTATSKALGLTYGAGWTFRRTERLSVQIFGAQHVATLGDLETSTQKVENVIGNFWSVGAALVIR
jgi:Outer membrane protein beta-barrel domain